MGASQSATPKCLVYGVPGAGRKTLVEALRKRGGDLELVLPERASDAETTADLLVYVLDATKPDAWAAAAAGMLETLHSVNKAVGRLVPLVVCVNKRDFVDSAPARQVVEQMRLTGDVCSAVGGRVWRVVDCSARRDNDVIELGRMLRHMADAGRSIKPSGILAPKWRGASSGDAQGPCASLP